MINILNKPYTNEQYAEFASTANTCQQRIEIQGDKVFRLQPYEIVENEQIVDISNTPEYEEKETRKILEELQCQCIKTSLGYLRRQTKVGELLGVFNTYAVMVQQLGKLPKGVLLIYHGDGSTSFNGELSAQEFSALFDEVTGAYLEFFKED